MYIPIIGIFNLLSGLILSAKLFEGIVSKEFVHKFLSKVGHYRKIIAQIDIVIGIVALINRLNILDVWFIHGGFPQIIVILAVGLTLGSELTRGFPAVHNFVVKNLDPYKEYVGVVGILFGLYSIF